MKMFALAVLFAFSAVAFAEEPTNTTAPAAGAPTAEKAPGKTKKEKKKKHEKKKHEKHEK